MLCYDLPCTVFKGILILRPATRKELSSRPPQYLLDELHRLQSLERTSHKELERYITSLPTAIPANILQILRPEITTQQEQTVQAVRAMRKPEVAMPSRTNEPRLIHTEPGPTRKRLRTKKKNSRNSNAWCIIAAFLNS